MFSLEPTNWSIFLVKNFLNVVLACSKISKTNLSCFTLNIKCHVFACGTDRARHSLFWVHCTLFRSFCCCFNGPYNNNNDGVIHPFLKSQNTYVPSLELEPPTPLACGWGGGGSQFRRLEKKPSTLLRYAAHSWAMLHPTELRSTLLTTLRPMIHDTS